MEALRLICGGLWRPSRIRYSLRAVSPRLSFRFSSPLPFSRTLHARARAGVGFTGYCTPGFHYLRVSTMRTLPSIIYLSLSVFLVSVCSFPAQRRNARPAIRFKEHRLNYTGQGQRDSLSVIMSQLMGEEK